MMMMLKALIGLGVLDEYMKCVIFVSCHWSAFQIGVGIA